MSINLVVLINGDEIYEYSNSSNMDVFYQFRSNSRSSSPHLYFKEESIAEDDII